MTLPQVIGDSLQRAAWIRHNIGVQLKFPVSSPAHECAAAGSSRPQPNFGRLRSMLSPLVRGQPLPPVIHARVFVQTVAEADAAGTAWCPVVVSGECRDVHSAYLTIKDQVDEVDDVVVKFRLAPSLRSALLARDMALLRTIAADSDVRVHVPSLSDPEAALASLEGAADSVFRVFDGMWEALDETLRKSCKGSVAFPHDATGLVIGPKGSKLSAVQAATSVRDVNVSKRPFTRSDLVAATATAALTGPIKPGHLGRGGMVGFTAGQIAELDARMRPATAGAEAATGAASGRDAGELGEATVFAGHRSCLETALLAFAAVATGKRVDEAVAMAQRAMREAGWPVPVQRAHAGLWISAVPCEGAAEAGLSSEPIGGAGTHRGGHGSTTRGKKATAGGHADGASSWRSGDAASTGKPRSEASRRGGGGRGRGSGAAGGRSRA